MEANFSGTITDSLGRKVTFQDGKRVSGPQDAKPGAQGVKPVKAPEDQQTQNIPVGKLEPQKPQQAGLQPSESFKANAPPATYVSLDEQKRIGGILGIDQWVLRKVSEKDVQKLDALAARLRDPEQKKALNDVINRIDNAVMNGGGYSFIPKGVIRPQANKPKPLPLKVGGAVAPEKRGIENTKPVEPSPKPKLTHSILTHRSPKNRTTDRPRTKGETAYSNILHNQVEPTPEEWKALQGDVHKFGRDQLMRLVRRFNIELQKGNHPTMKGLRKAIADHVTDIQEHGAQTTGIAPELGKDRRSSQYQDKHFTQFRPLRKF